MYFSLKYGVNVVGSRRSHVFGLIINKTDGSAYVQALLAWEAGSRQQENKVPVFTIVKLRSRSRSRFSPSGSNFRSLLRKCGSMRRWHTWSESLTRYVNYHFSDFNDKTIRFGLLLKWDYWVSSLTGLGGPWVRTWCLHVSALWKSRQTPSACSLK